MHDHLLQGERGKEAKTSYRIREMRTRFAIKGKEKKSETQMRLDTSTFRGTSTKRVHLNGKDDVKDQTREPSQARKTQKKEYCAHEENEENKQLLT